MMDPELAALLLFKKRNPDEYRRYCARERFLSFETLLTDIATLVAQCPDVDPDDVAEGFYEFQLSLAQSPAEREAIGDVIARLKIARLARPN
jgi:hypothetical protein